MNLISISDARRRQLSEAREARRQKAEANARAKRNAQSRVTGFIGGGIRCSRCNVPLGTGAISQDEYAVGLICLECGAIKLLIVKN